MKETGNLKHLLKQGYFVVTSELDPPKGNDLNILKRKVEHLKGYVDAVNIPDNQSGIVTMSSLVASWFAAQMGVEPIMHITTRDRNRIALQSDLFGATAMGIRNILCMSGVHQSFGNQIYAKNVYDLDSIQLIECAKTLREKGTLIDKEEKIEGKIDLFIGAVINPFADPSEFQTTRLAKKIRAGAEFIQTYPIFDLERFKDWMKRVRQLGLDQKTFILVSICYLNSKETLRELENRFPGVLIPGEIVSRIEKSDNEEMEGIKLCVEQISEVRKIEGIHGVCLIHMGYEKSIPSLLEQSGLFPRPTL